MPATTAVPLVVKLTESAHRPPQFVTGAHAAVRLPEGHCAPSYLEAWLAPGAAYTILGLPLDAVGEEFVDLSEALGPSGRLLGERLRAASSWATRFEVLDAFLLRRLGTGPVVDPQVREVWHRLASTSGGGRIGVLATQVGWSHKHLISRFRRQIGVTPKRAAALMRFDAVLRQVRQDPRPDWSRLAAENGYTDQAHLIHDFKRFAGETPVAFLSGRAERLRHPVIGGYGRA